MSVSGKNRRTGKAENVIVLEKLFNLAVHQPELAAVTFIKNQNDMLIGNRVAGISRNKVIKLLNRGDDDFVLVGIAFFVSVFKLSLQNLCVAVAVGRSFFKAVIFFHRLIVKVFTVNNKNHLVDIFKTARKLRSLE